MAIRILKTRAFKITAVLLSVGIILIAVLQFAAKRYVVRFFNERVPDHIRLEYDRININVLAGSIALTDVVFAQYGKNTGLKRMEVHLDTAKIEGFGYFKFLFADAINVNGIRLVRPKLRYYGNDPFTKGKSFPDSWTERKKELSIADFQIVEGEFAKASRSLDSVGILIEKFNLSVKDIKTDKEFFEKEMPFSFGDYSLRTGKISVDLSPFEVLGIQGISIENKEVKLRNLSLKSRYDRVALSKKLGKERDHMNLEIPEVELSKMDFGFDSGRFFLKTKSLTMLDPTLEMYRDKLIVDDLVRKKLYSQMLRDFKMDLDISQVNIKNGHISYAELVEEGTEPGKVVFSNLQSTMYNISNILGNKEGTKIEIEARLMETAPIQLKWNFDSRKENDAFVVSGSVKNFESESLNQFLRSNLRIKAEGNIEQLYFTFSGDAISSSGDLKMRYDNFGFVVLKENRAGVNKLLTFIGNVFTNDGSRADAEGYRYGNISAERDSTKSFFNYLWINVRDGIVSALTGNGKKNDDLD